MRARGSFTVTPSLTETDFRRVARAMQWRMNPVQSRLMRTTALLYVVLIALVLVADTTLFVRHALRPIAVLVEALLGLGAPAAYVFSLRYSVDRAVRRTWLRVRDSLPVHYAFSEDGFAVQSRGALSAVPWSAFDHSVAVAGYLLLCYPDGRYVTIPLRDLTADRQARLERIAGAHLPRLRTFRR